MKRLVLAAMVMVGGWAGAAEPMAQKSCAQTISENSKYPAQLKATLTAVADLHQQHAQWVGTSTKEAKAESQLLMQVAKDMREAAKHADKLATRMQSAKDLKEAKHDEKNMPTSLIMAMERARDEQRKLGELMTTGASEMDQALQTMKGVGGSGTGGSGASDPMDMSTPEVPMDDVPPGDMETSEPLPPQKK